MADTDATPGPDAPYPVTVEFLRSKTIFPLGRPQRFWWRVVAPNGKILARSEMYRNKSDCVSIARKLFVYNPRTAFVDSTNYPKMRFPNGIPRVEVGK